MRVSRSLAVTGLSSQPALEPVWLARSPTLHTPLCDHPTGRTAKKHPSPEASVTQVEVNTVAAAREDDGGFNGDRDHRVGLRVAERVRRLRSPPPTNRADSGDCGRPDLSVAMHRGGVTAVEWYPD